MILSPLLAPLTFLIARLTASAVVGEIGSKGLQPFSGVGVMQRKFGRTESGDVVAFAENAAAAPTWPGRRPERSKGNR